MDECRDADPDVANELASSGLLADLRRQSKTGHENETGKVFEKRGLALPVPLTYIDLGKEKKHPVLKVSDMLQVLAEEKQATAFSGVARSGKPDRQTSMNSGAAIAIKMLDTPYSSSTIIVSTECCHCRSTQMKGKH